MCGKPISGLPGTIAVATQARCSARARNTFASCRLVCCRSASSGIETRRSCWLLFCCCRCVARFRIVSCFEICLDDTGNRLALSIAVRAEGVGDIMALTVMGKVGGADAGQGGGV